MINKNLTRLEVIRALSNSFQVDEKEVRKSLEKYFPKNFFPLISMKEYKEFLAKFKSEFKQ